MIKCIVCDLDGTLIKYDDSIEEKTYELLKKCIAQGIEFIIATGRDMNMVIDILDRYQLKCDMILNNGAQYYQYQTQENIIYPMDDYEVIRIVRILHEKNYLLAIHTNQGKYSLRKADDFWEYHMRLLLSHFKYLGGLLPEKTFTIKEKYLRDFHYVENTEEILKQGAKVLKIDARHIDSNSIQGVREQLNSDKLDITSSYESNIEITSSQSNKGILLKKIMEQKGYKEDEVVVFGDGENDCFMLKLYPYSFAPKNASQHAKDAANYHLKHDNECGAVGEGISLLHSMGLISYK